MNQPAEAEPWGEISPWAWLIVFLVVGVSFYTTYTDDEFRIGYNHWFLQQVEDGNVASLAVEGVEAHGVLYECVEYPSRTIWKSWRVVRKFRMDFPSEATVQSAVDRLRRDGAAVQVGPPSRRGLYVILAAMAALLALMLAYLWYVFRPVPVGTATAGATATP